MRSQTLTADPRSMLSSLVGLPVTLVEASYGGELVIGMGATRPSRPPLTGLDAEWMLHTQMSAWVVEGPEGVVSTSRQRDYAKAVDRARPEVLNHKVADVSIRNAVFGLTIRLSDGAAIVVLPEAVDVRKEPHEPVWSLHGPDRLVVVAVPAEGLIFGDPHASA